MNPDSASGLEGLTQQKKSRREENNGAGTKVG